MTEQKKLEVSENQLAQMAQQEEDMLAQRQRLLEKMTESLRETIGAQEALEAIQTHKGTVLMKLGAGILIEATISADTCKRSFSEDGYKEETLAEAITGLEARKVHIEKQAQTVAREINAGQQRLSQLISILQQLEAEKKKNFSISSKK